MASFKYSNYPPSAGNGAAPQSSIGSSSTDVELRQISAPRTPILICTTTDSGPADRSAAPAWTSNIRSKSRRHVSDRPQEKTTEAQDQGSSRDNGKGWELWMYTTGICASFWATGCRRWIRGVQHALADRVTRTAGLTAPGTSSFAARAFDIKFFLINKSPYTYNNVLNNNDNEDRGN